MNPQLFQQPFFSVALPIMVTLLIAAWNQNKRLSDIQSNFNRRLDDIIAGLDRIETKPHPNPTLIN